MCLSVIVCDCVHTTRSIVYKFFSLFLLLRVCCMQFACYYMCYRLSSLVEHQSRHCTNITFTKHLNYTKLIINFFFHFSTTLAWFVSQSNWNLHSFVLFCSRLWVFFKLFVSALFLLFSNWIVFVLFFFASSLWSSSSPTPIQPDQFQSIHFSLIFDLSGCVWLFASTNILLIAVGFFFFFFFLCVRVYFVSDLSFYYSIFGCAQFNQKLTKATMASLERNSIFIFGFI